MISKLEDRESKADITFLLGRQSGGETPKIVVKGEAVKFQTSVSKIYFSKAFSQIFTEIFFPDFSFLQFFNKVKGFRSGVKNKLMEKRSWM